MEEQAEAEQERIITEREQERMKRGSLPERIDIFGDTLPPNRSSIIGYPSTVMEMKSLDPTRNNFSENAASSMKPLPSHMGVLGNSIPSSRLSTTDCSSAIVQWLFQNGGALLHS
ncbi:hypothetical protein [Wolbachia endosymbiont of Ctenocephalides felis wCfeT]|uniref:hypothetical protein n=1 Tax=Wolbachia endosymbiont of Ctenocephalides felis wCfeT TaxID=2732593 RepID=UPI001446290E|nr:hypothetical protein [Wolbachia endosymbiont of Ctenocephalides felis wCfeT]